MSTSEIRQQSIETPNNAAKGERIAWVDAAKGIGIIFVVIGHVLVGMRDSHLARPESMLLYVLHLIYSFHMPLFFFLSGIFIARRVAGGALTFAKTSTTKLAKAYFIWLPVQMLIVGLAGQLANKPLEGSLLSYLSIIWIPRDNFWYIYALAVMNLFAALVIPRLGVAVMLVSCLLFYSIAQWNKIPPFIWGFFWFAPYYAAGIIYGVHPLKMQASKLTTAAAALAFTLAWLYIAHELKRLGTPLWAVATFSTAITGSVATFLWVGCLGKSASGFLSYLGREALTIYVIHVTFTAGSRIFLDKFLHVEDVYVYLVVCTGLGILGPLAIKKMADKLKISKQIGLA